MSGEGFHVETDHTKGKKCNRFVCTITKCCLFCAFSVFFCAVIFIEDTKSVDEVLLMLLLHLCVHACTHELDVNENLSVDHKEEILSCNKLPLIS